MNKAFTANINDQVTARGYLDENDQLIMLEPEGSGGGAYGSLVTVNFESVAGGVRLQYPSNDDGGVLIFDNVYVVGNEFGSTPMAGSIENAYSNGYLLVSGGVIKSGDSDVPADADSIAGMIYKISKLAALSNLTIVAPEDGN